MFFNTVFLLLGRKARQHHLPKKCMMFYTAFPEMFACDLVTCLKKEGSFIALKAKQKKSTLL